jgi:hypothetical protein
MPTSLSVQIRAISEIENQNMIFRVSPTDEMKVRIGNNVRL